MKCPVCNTENKSHLKKCSHCRFEFDAPMIGNLNQAIDETVDSNLRIKVYRAFFENFKEEILKPSDNGANKEVEAVRREYGFLKKEVANLRDRQIEELMAFEVEDNLKIIDIRNVIATESKNIIISKMRRSLSYRKKKIKINASFDEELKTAITHFLIQHRYDIAKEVYRNYKDVIKLNIDKHSYITKLITIILIFLSFLLAWVLYSSNTNPNLPLGNLLVLRLPALVISVIILLVLLRLFRDRTESMDTINSHMFIKLSKTHPEEVMLFLRNYLESRKDEIQAEKDNTDRLIKLIAGWLAPLVQVSKHNKDTNHTRKS